MSQITGQTDTLAMYLMTEDLIECASH